MLLIALRLRCCSNAQSCGNNLRRYISSTTAATDYRQKLQSQFLRFFSSPSPKVLICGGLCAVKLLKFAQCNTGAGRLLGSAASGHQLKPGRRRRELAAAIDSSIPWSDIWKVTLLNVGYIVGAIVTAILAAIVNIKLPLLLGDVVNIVTSIKHEPNAVNALVPAALKLVSLYAVQGVLTFVYICLVSVWGERLASHLRTQLFHHLLVQDIAFFDSHRSGELVARLSTDVQEFKSAFKQCISQGLRSVTQTVGCIISLYIISPQMTGVTVSVLPCIILCGALLGSSLRHLSRKAQAQVAVASSVADEAISNIRTVRAFAMEATENGLYQAELAKAQYLNEILGVGIGVFQGVANFALNGIVLGVIYGGSKLISADSLSPGQLTSFLVTAQTIQRSLAQLSLLYGQAVKGLSAGARIFEYIHLEPRMNVRGGRTIPYHSLMGDVRFENVRFAYPTRPGHVVLEEFNLHIPAGKVVALCGPSGGGKSTVAALLERFYDVTEGEITIDGNNIRDLDPKWLRGRTIGFISQEPVLFHTTIKENIRYGKPDATDQEIFEAAKLANAHSFIASFPHGYNTMVGERGVALSGGQKQRVAIARALLKKPSILILDEATSALDAESERLVQEALDQVGKGRTVLVIAHRLSTVQNADLIAVIANKRVAEVGTHQELLKRHGIYRQLIKYQQQVPEDRDADDGHWERQVDIDRYREAGFDIDVYW